MGIDLVIRLWDTYISELFQSPQMFNDFLTFFSCTFLNHWREEILKLDFQSTVIYLQKLPTANWTIKDVEALIAKSHVDRALFANSSEKIEIEKILRSQEESY